MGEPVTTNNGTVPVDETTKRAALAEEEAMYEKLKVGCTKGSIWSIWFNCFQIQSAFSLVYCIIIHYMKWTRQGLK